MLRKLLRQNAEVMALKSRYLAGEISLAEANELGAKYLEDYNQTAKQIARKYNRKHENIKLSRVW